MKINETYIWIVIVAVVLAVALYFRYMYQPSLGIELSMNASAQGQLYPYQTSYLPIKAYNTGSAPITNMSVGIEINNNLTRLYKITLPPGKETVIYYNYTPKEPGNYNISAVADPGKLYNIADRSRTKAGADLQVLVPENAMPYGMLPSGNITSSGAYDVRGAGFIASSFLYGSYNISEFGLTSIRDANRLLYPVFNSVAYYIANLSVAHANYSDGSVAYSIWLKGYISQNITNTAAALYGINAMTADRNGKNITFVEMKNGTSVCSFYSKGWIKMLAFSGADSCLSALNSTGNATLAENPLYNKTVPKNTSIFGNFSDSTGEIGRTATLYLENNSIIYSSITSNDGKNSTCSSHRNYGVVSTYDGISFCSTYITQTSSSKNLSIALLETKAFVGNYNLSVLSLINVAKLSDQVPINIGIIRGFNITGQSIQFVSGFKNTCSFNTSSFGCDNATLSNSTLTFGLTDNAGNAIRLNGISCYELPPQLEIGLNKSMTSGSEASISVPCYNLGKSISGLTLGLNLNILLNYTIDNKTQTTLGSAHLTIG